MKRTRWLLVVAVLLFFWLALNSMIYDSPTMDEQNHLARGMAFLRTGDPRLSLEHPPLINSISALPLLLLPDVVVPTDHPSWSRRQGWYEFAEQFMWEVNDDVTRMVFLGRLPIVMLTLGLGLVGLQFARELWGAPAGAFAFVMLLFDPNILAHGRYSTTDVGGTLFILLSAYLVWRFYQRPSSKRRFVAGGVSLGLAYSSKLSALAFAPILAYVAILPLFGQPRQRRQAAIRFLQFGIMNVISLFVVWAAYGLQWGPQQFVTAQLTPLNAVRGPMPTFWAGIEQVLAINQGGRPAFLLGRTSTEGFLGYFPVAFLVKTPLATLILIFSSGVFLLRRRSDRNRALFLLLPSVFYFLLTIQSGLNIGYRHLLPTLPFLYVMIAGFIARVYQPPDKANLARIWYRVSRPMALGLVGLLLITTLVVHPYYLSYFNLAAGGPANGYKILIDSNLDWGQDLLRLQEWMRENEVDRVKLSWFGTADPQYYGLSYDPLPGLPRHFDLWWNVPFDPQDPEPGIYVISASNLWELPLQDEKVVFPWFRARPPDDRVAYSLLIYEVK